MLLGLLCVVTKSVHMAPTNVSPNRWISVHKALPTTSEFSPCVHGLITMKSPFMLDERVSSKVPPED